MTILGGVRKLFVTYPSYHLTWQTTIFFPKLFLRISMISTFFLLFNYVWCYITLFTFSVIPAHNQKHPYDSPFYLANRDHLQLYFGPPLSGRLRRNDNILIFGQKFLSGLKSNTIEIWRTGPSVFLVVKLNFYFFLLFSAKRLKKKLGHFLSHFQCKKIEEKVGSLFSAKRLTKNRVTF